jgi:hypothetical protein
MLIYDPAFDPYHSAVRILAILRAAQSRQLEVSIDAARITDYFLVYPYKIRSFRLPPEFSLLRKAANDSDNPYRRASGSRATFERMRSVFLAAVTGLVAAGLLDGEALKRGLISLADSTLPEILAAAVSQFDSRQTTVGRFLLSDFLSMPANGAGGLKDRSGLIEHRYDIA